jgi:ferric-dicitrate binding protein FerR (iron transport regulator)
VRSDHVKALLRLVCLAIIATAFGAGTASAQQPAQAGCTSAPGPNATQTLRCRDGLVIVVEDGATFTLQGRGGNVTAVALQSKALLVDAPRQPGKSQFRVTTPQAIAAVRGTKWAVDVGQTRTSVLVLQGRVGVRRSAGAAQVFLGPGEGVDVDPGAEPLVVKRWGQPRVDALLARLGQ